VWAVALLCAYQMPFPTGRSPPRSLTLASARTRGWPVSMGAPTFDSFEELAGEITSYLGTLDEAALQDPEAPSPLSYLELQAAGRTDLVQGCMKHGGYLAVSNKMGVRLKSSPPPPTAVNPWTQPVEEEEEVGVTLSGAAKEEKMAADLDRLARRTADAVISPESSPVASAPRGDRLAPMRAAGRSESSSSSSSGSSSSASSLQPDVYLDGVQRAEMALLIGLFAAGFGRTSEQVLPPGLVAGAQSAFAALAVGHLLVAGYSVVLAARAPAEQRHSPPLWFVKCVITGVGGLRQLQQAVDNTAA